MYFGQQRFECGIYTYVEEFFLVKTHLEHTCHLNLTSTYESYVESTSEVIDKIVSQLSRGSVYRVNLDVILVE